MEVIGGFWPEERQDLAYIFKESLWDMREEMDAPGVLPEHLKRWSCQTQRWERKEFEGRRCGQVTFEMSTSE